MDTRFYLSVFPEALIASQLSPEDFGNYYAVGGKKRTRGQAIFFEVDRNFESDYFDFKHAIAKCDAHPEGHPKRSAYVAIYRVLENVPLSSLKRLYLATDDGRVLGLDRAPYTPSADAPLHYYQELCPGTLSSVSALEPDSFCRRLTDASQPISVPTLFFCDLKLNGLASDPKHGKTQDLPYANLDHLRDCLTRIVEHPEKPLKTVSRHMSGPLFYRTVRTGFFVGNAKDFVFYPFPSREELEDGHYAWWRSALTVGLGS